MYAKTILYARASTPQQTNESQWPELRRWAVKEQVNVMEVEDIGTGKNMSRKGIKGIITGIKAGEIKRVVVVSINRVGRNVAQCHEFFDLCKDYEVELLSLREKVDLSSPMGRCFISLLSVLAVLENEQRSEATRAGIAAAREQADREGRPWRTGGAIPGYSTKVTKETAETILYWHNKRLNYCAIGRIVKLSDKTVRDVCLNPRREYISRKELGKRLKSK
jgi:DNA invertase Pin-like site-specific DNA recombinase